MAAGEVKAATTLTELMRRRAALTPDAPYFHLYGETVTYRRLWEQSARHAAGLARAGVGMGERVCLIYPTSTWRAGRPRLRPRARTTSPSSSTPRAARAIREASC